MSVKYTSDFKDMVQKKVKQIYNFYTNVTVILRYIKINFIWLFLKMYFSITIDIEY